MRSIVYIDGFNLYYGCLKRAPELRWLDIEALARRLCREHDPDGDVSEIKYFTAPIKARLSARGNAACRDQQDYWLALRTHCPNISIISGKFVIAAGSFHRDSEPVCFSEKVRILRAEEKQSDVNIALHMLSDATDMKCEQQVLIGNDSDCVPALRMIRARCPSMVLGVIAPIARSEISNRLPVRELLDSADWARRRIACDELSVCQLPERVRTRKRVVQRPQRWSSLESEHY